VRLVRSSVPGAVERDQTIRLLAERAVLTRMVCRELLDCDIRGGNRRSRTALFLLLRWIGENHPESVRVEPRATDGLDRMIVQEGFSDILQEITDGAQVCQALFMLFAADNRIQVEHDCATIEARLKAYWIKHGSAVPIRQL
jgi:hypothetical protein